MAGGSLSLRSLSPALLLLLTTRMLLLLLPPPDSVAPEVASAALPSSILEQVARTWHQSVAFGR